MKKEKIKLGLKIVEYILPHLPKDFNFDKLKKEFARATVITYDNIEPGGFQKRTRTTLLIDLKKLGQDDIFSQFKYETRHKIRKADKMENLKIVAADKNFEDNYLLYKNFEYKQGRVPFDKKQMKNSIYFSAYLNNHLVSHVICDNIDNQVFRVKNISSVRLDVQDKKFYRELSFVSRRVMYEAIKYAEQQGIPLFDFNGVNLEDPTKKGISEFKMSFGGELSNEYIYTYKSPLVKLLEKILKLKLFLKKIIKK